MPDAVAQVIAEYLGETASVAESSPVEQLALPMDPSPVGDLCPDCGQASFIAAEGCRKCFVCGFSEC